MRKIVTAIAGGILLILGVVMIPLPGPGLPVVVAALALLAREFQWARQTRDKVMAALSKRKGNPSPPTPDVAAGKQQTT